MKKLIIPAVLTAALLISSCGKGGNTTPSPSPVASPSSTFILLGETPSGEIGDYANNPDSTAGAEQESESGTDNESGSITDENSGTSASGYSTSDSVSIINSSSTAFYAVYLSTSSGGNPGENIIGDTPLGEGEEIDLPFANAPSESLTVIVEDENGIRYSAGGVNLSNGLTIELHLEGGVLNAIVY